MSTEPASVSPIKLTVAAVVPLYNAELFIASTLASVLGQTRKADQIVVVNDGSSDRSPSIVETMAKEHHEITLIHKTNGGQASARNIGVRATTCDLIAFLDADDIWNVQHLEALVAPFEASERDRPLGWVYSDVDVIGANGTVLFRHGLKQNAAQHPKRDVFDCLQHAMFVFPSATIISRASFDTVGGFDERLSPYEDDDFFLRVLSAGFDNVYLDQCLTQYRVLNNSSSHSIRMSRSRIFYIKKLLDEYRRGDVPNCLAYYQIMARRFLPELGGDLLRAVEESDKERRHLSRAGFELLWPYFDMKAKIQIVFGIALSYLPAAVSKPAFALRHRLWEKQRARW